MSERERDRQTETDRQTEKEKKKRKKNTVKSLMTGLEPHGKPLSSAHVTSFFFSLSLSLFFFFFKFFPFNFYLRTLYTREFRL